MDTVRVRGCIFGVKNAEEYVFRMGRPSDVATAPGLIGQFGVGMKRALFKLGSRFLISSTTEDDSFSIELNVPAWVKEKGWGIPMTIHELAPGDATGTTIVVDAPHPHVARSFRDPAVIEELRRELASRHRLAVGNGLTLSLNGDEIPRTPSRVAMSTAIAPAVRSLTIPISGGELTVRIVAGVVAESQAGIDEDGAPEQQSRAASEAGWMVFGNGRLLLANDQSRTTGWGSGRNNMPQFHNQFSRFRGFVYMDSSDANAIPWNTMKTSVDPDSPIWRQIVGEMIAAGRDVIDLLNSVKDERQLASTDEERPITVALRSATSVEAVDAFETVRGTYSMSITELRGEIAVAATFPARNPDLVAALEKIQYQVEADAFDELVAATGTTNAAEIGRQSFDLYYTQNVRQ